MKKRYLYFLYALLMGCISSPTRKALENPEKAVCSRIDNYITNRQPVKRNVDLVKVEKIEVKEDKNRNQEVLRFARIHTTAPFDYINWRACPVDGCVPNFPYTELTAPYLLPPM